MFFSLKITPKHEMSNDALWPLCGLRFSITAEAKLVISPRPAVELTGSMAKADVWNQALNQHPSVLSPLQGCQQRALGCTALPGERDTSLCPACHWRPGHTREAAQRWPTYSIPVCCGVLWPGVVRKREQTGKLQTTPAIQTKRWKPARTKSGVIKKIDWLRCNAAFVCKTLPCKSIQSSSRFSEARGQRDPSDGSTWNSTTRFAEDFQRSYSKHRQKKEKDPHPMEPIWT